MTFNKLFSTLLFSFLYCSLSSGIALAKPTNIPGTKTFFELPGQFEIAKQFTGIKHKNQEASISINEIQAPYQQIANDMSFNNLAGNNITLVRQDTVKVNQTEGRFIKVKELVKGKNMFKRLLLFGDSSSSVLIVGLTPFSLDNTLGKVIEDTMLKVIWDKNAETDLLQGLDFSIPESKDLKYTSRVANIITLTKEKANPNDSKSPIMIVGSAIDKSKITDLAEFAKKKLFLNNSLNNISILKSEKTQIDGNAAFAIVAEATFSDKKIELMVYQLVIERPNGYAIAQGRVGKFNSQIFLNQFKTLAHAIKFK